MTEDERSPEDLKPTETLSGRPDGSTLPSLPEKFGHYRIVGKLGEGGMGVVYEAQQEEPVRRRVALKLIKLGMDTGKVIARFDSERQALALMSHPNIAKVFDAGSTPDGRPYFVMEYIPGAPITQFCDAQRLSTRERLQLFMPICQAVQHAHLKGIIHRDLKPSNVLVALQEDRPVPKIIDFGVAKATEQRLTEQTVFTELGQMVGTPEYMSPEQAALSGIDIDTRTDVYSLGVLLYELLVGALPFDARDLRRAGFEEIRRRIREEEPARPSTRVRALGERSAPAATMRRTDPASHVRQLRGDLDWITMKAMEKARARRYTSALELSMDIDRHLGHEPVLARPPSALYRCGKFVRRHRVGVTAAAVVLLALVAGIVGTTAGLVRATRAERAARREAATAKQVSDFLSGLFEGSDPYARGHAVTVREILDTGTARIDRELRDQPLVRARLMSTMGNAYGGLGESEEAGRLVEEALRIRQELLGEENLEVAASYRDLGMWHSAVKGEVMEARPAFERSLAIREKILGTDHADVGESLFWLGNNLTKTADFERARPLLERSLEILEKVTPPDHNLLGFAQQALAGLLANTGDYKRALPLYEKGLENHERYYGPEHAMLMFPLSYVARMHRSAGDFAKARAFRERSLRINEKVFGADSPEVAMALRGVARLMIKMGDHAAARPLLERSLAIYEKSADPDENGLIVSLVNLGDLLTRTGDYDEANRHLERARSIATGATEPDENRLYRVYWSLARLSLARGEPAEAGTLFEQALEHLKRESLENPRMIRGFLEFKQACHQALIGDRDGAIRLLKEAIDLGCAFPDMASDPDLQPLHGDPEFEAIVEELGKRAWGG